MLRPLTRVELRPEDRAEVRCLVRPCRSALCTNARSLRPRRPRSRSSQRSACMPLLATSAPVSGVPH